MNEKPLVIAFLYDESGNMGRPWAEAGAICHCFDLLNEDGREEIVGAGKIVYHNRNLFDQASHDFIKALAPDAIIGFPPCDHLAVSGSRHFERKRQLNPRFQLEAMELVMLVVDLGNMLGVPWAFENPVSVISSMYRKPDWSFDPYDYGAHLPENDVHPRWPGYIAPRDAYPKKTCIWTGNGIKQPPIHPVPCRPGYSDQFHKLGGKSKKTKMIRSETARGFALAFFKTNFPVVLQRRIDRANMPPKKPW